MPVRSPLPVTAAIPDAGLREDASENLPQMEGGYRDLLEAAPDAMVVVNQRGEIVLLNLQAERRFGYRRDELLGQNIKNIIPEGFAERLLADALRSAEDALSQQIGTGIELIGRRKDGSGFPFELMLSPLVSAEGILVTAWIRDVTSRKQAQEALRASEAKFRGILESAPDAMVISDFGGRILLINAETERVFGYPREELVGQAVEILVPVRFRGKHPGHRHGYTAHPRTRSMGEGLELSGLRKDNTEFPIEISLSPIETPEGTFISSAIRDVTSRKQAQEALRASNERLRLTIEAAEIGTWFWDIQKDEVSCSEKFRALFGLTSGDTLTYQAWVAMTHPDDKEYMDRSIKKTLELGVPLRIEHRIIWPDSSVHWIMAKGRAHRNSEGVAVHMQGIIADITERKTAQETLKHQEVLERRSAELTRSNADLEQFAYIAAHDLQEPLRMVASYTQLLSKRYKGRLDSDADEFIAFAVDGAHRMQLLIADLLAYCRVATTGKIPSKTSSEDALELALLNLQSALKESGGVVTHDPLPTVIADGVQLAQIFQNVVGNAIKYRSAEIPRVHVFAKKNDRNEWVFSMRDNGLGIEPQHFEKIFVMFQRLHGRTEFSGTGIGLAVCKKIAERHGGRMWVESAPAMGSTFYLALPERE